MHTIREHGPDGVGGFTPIPAMSPVPESADWWDASYLIVWGTNLPITRTPDAHSC